MSDIFYIGDAAYDLSDLQGMYDQSWQVYQLQIGPDSGGGDGGPLEDFIDAVGFIGEDDYSQIPFIEDRDGDGDVDATDLVVYGRENAAQETDAEIREELEHRANVLETWANLIDSLQGDDNLPGG